MAATHIVIGTPLTATVAQGAVSGNATASCASGLLVGGGASLSTSTGVAVHTSFPSSGTTWTANFVGTGPGSNSGTITAYAICSGTGLAPTNARHARRHARRAPAPALPHR